MGGGEGAHPLHPPPRSAPGVTGHTKKSNILFPKYRGNIQPLGQIIKCFPLAFRFLSWQQVDDRSKNNLEVLYRN